MRKIDLMFTLTLLMTLSFLFYFLDSSITGYVTTSTYCEEGECRELCRLDSECDRDERCCRKFNFGVCEDSSVCEFEFQKEVSESDPSYEPKQVTKSKIVLYSILVIMALITGWMYFLGGKRKKNVKPTN